VTTRAALIFSRPEAAAGGIDLCENALMQLSSSNTNHRKKWHFSGEEVFGCGKAEDRWLSLITRGMTTLPRSKKNQPDSIISDGDWYNNPCAEIERAFLLAGAFEDLKVVTAKLI